jgi:hypothetical protein
MKRFNRLCRQGIAAFAILAMSATSCEDRKVTRETEKTITYTASDEDFPNPERGFYRYSQTTASNYSFLSEQLLKSYRQTHSSSGASYAINSTLVFRYYVLDVFKDGPLSGGFLNNLKTDFETARKAGVKLIPRFTYSISTTEGPCPESFICPPYGDAPKAIVLEQIEQLKPLLFENADVILSVQLGFIGTWGENYYTDYFGDASSNGQGKLLDENWQDRIDVVKAMLDATPTELMVQIRYPQFKQRAVYGINAGVTSAPLTEAEAFTESDKARLGFHNDCFLASGDDFGTYQDYGNSTSPRTSATTTLRQYFSEDSKFVLVGGETCSDGYSPQNDCSPAGKAEEEMEMLHYTYLNADYNNQVNNDWETGGCMQSIKRRLGYRFSLKSATLPLIAKKNNPLSLSISIVNSGFTSPVKLRPVRLILRSQSDGALHTFDFATDIRKWFPGEITLTMSGDISAVPAGKYDMLLHLPDAHETLTSRPEYAIRLANADTWIEAEGFNDLQNVVEVE